jgi:hypothetical protein
VRRYRPELTSLRGIWEVVRTYTPISTETRPFSDQTTKTDLGERVVGYLAAAVNSGNTLAWVHQDPQVRPVVDLGEALVPAVPSEDYIASGEVA